MKNIYISIIVLLFCSLSTNAQRFFMRIVNPNILGNVTTPNDHVNDIKLESFNYNLNNSRSMPFNPNAGSYGKVQAPLITVIIPSGRASADLFSAVTVGTLFEKVTVYAQVNTSTNGLQDYAIYEFGYAVFSSINVGVTEANSENNVALTFKAANLKVKFKPILPSGDLDPEEEYGWNFQTNAPF